MRHSKRTPLRLDRAREVLSRGGSVAEAARAAKVSRRTMARWMREGAWLGDAARSTPGPASFGQNCPTLRPPAASPAPLESEPTWESVFRPVPGRPTVEVDEQTLQLVLNWLEEIDAFLGDLAAAEQSGVLCEGCPAREEVRS